MGLKLRVTIRCQHEFVEELCIKETWVWLPGPGSVASLLRIGRDRDLFPHLEAHLKVFGDLIQVSPELIRRGGTVEGRVIAYGLEERLALVLILAVLAETFPRKRALRVLACVDLALPAFVGLGGNTELD